MIWAAAAKAVAVAVNQVAVKVAARAAVKAAAAKVGAAVRVAVNQAAAKAVAAAVRAAVVARAAAALAVAVVQVEEAAQAAEVAQAANFADDNLSVLTNSTSRIFPIEMRAKQRASKGRVIEGEVRHLALYVFTCAYRFDPRVIARPARAVRSCRARSSVEVQLSLRSS